MLEEQFRAGMVVEPQPSRCFRQISFSASLCAN